MTHVQTRDEHKGHNIGRHPLAPSLDWCRDCLAPILRGSTNQTAETAHQIREAGARFGIGGSGKRNT